MVDVPKKVVYDLEESENRLSAMSSKLEEYLIRVDDFVKSANTEFMSLDSRDLFLQDDVDILSKRMDRLVDSFYNRISTTLIGENSLITLSIKQHEEQTIKNIEEATDSSSENYKAIQESYRAMSLQKLSGMESFSQLLSMVGDGEKNYGYAKIFKQTFIDKHSIKIIDGTVRYFGSNDVIKYIFGGNVRRTTVDTFGDYSVNKFIGGIKGKYKLTTLNGLLNYVSLGLEANKNYEQLNLSGDYDQYIVDNIGSLYNNVATVVAGQATSTGVGWALVTIAGFSNPVLVFVGATAVTAIVVKPVIDWSTEKIKDAVKNSQMTNIENLGEFDALNKLVEDGYDGYSKLNWEDYLKKNNSYSKELNLDGGGGAF
ncbi:hypothetical protein [Isobaculum melis]|uniref:LXG domain of WXG superfamily protein n=1 Tax=Isobaculum melis TaxID=142588 RepID=A0A1H9UJQ5_9LACT|nr:hypothetical protein [Isobaculum melis]SES09424.1 hypothetical protein SAMN04488559_1336 [Isobaculum melis]